MCGIAGIVHGDPGRPVDRAVLERMCDAVVHRGPDDRGIWHEPGVGLGHQRLSVIDLSPAGHQPMCNEDGTVWLVFNGEIYNFRELRDELIASGHRFRSGTDSEVLVHLYEERGDALVERIDGMFGFGIWDTRRRRLLLARDRVGKKPVKYAEIPGGLVFASELKSILATGLVERDVDLESIHQFLSLAWVPSPRTGFAAIRKLPPGHRLIWQDGAIHIDPYWCLDYRPKRRRSTEEWQGEVREEVHRAVRRRLISDVPLGAFLSGGIDSSIVVACMAGASSGPVETFSIGFEHEAYNELPHARKLAERYATSHHEFCVRADDASVLPSLAWHYEEPYADPAALPTYYLSRETRRHVTVALNGDGGDEGFCGYARYARAALWERRHRWVAATGASALARLLRSAASRVSPTLERWVDGLAHLSDPDPGRRYAWLLRLFSDREKERAYTDEMRAQMAQSGLGSISAFFEDPRAGSDALDRVAFADVRGYLPDCLMVKMDLASMAHSLEARSPLLDHHVLELAASIPAAQRCPDGALKWMLKQAFREALPADLIERPKQGFALPLHEWFRGPLRPLARDLLLSADTRIGRYLQPEVIRRWLEEHLSGRAARGVLLWGLVMLELWQREVVEVRARR